MNSIAVKTLIQNDPVLVRKRPMTAIPAGGMRSPWSNPNAYPTVPMKKFHITLSHKPFESDVSKKAPYASRPNSTNSVNYPKVVNGKTITMPAYNPLEDPHLAAYYERKLGLKASLLDGGKKNVKTKLEATKTVYSITTLTGDVKNSYTNARVFVQIRGTLGKIQKQQLIKKSESDVNGNSSFVFKRASSETFFIYSNDIGELISLDIEHDGVLRTQSWYLDEVVVKNQKTKKSWTFPCQSWLSLYESDCQIKRTLKPSSNNEQKSQRVVYEISVVTGDVKGAGTDAHVFITMFGDKGTAPRVQLINKIDHDNTGFAPGWFLDKVIITNTENAKEKWYFICNKWLSKDEGDKEISRTLLGTKSLENVPSAHKYTISTYTGDVRGAGTDANVYVTLFSKDGCSTEMQLNDSKNNFERKKVDTFNIECPDIGSLTRLRIRHDNTGAAAGWFLDKVVVKNSKNETFEFPCGKWLSDSEDDGQISRDLTVISANGVQGTPGIPYKLHITTGDVRGAGTSAKVYVILYGGKDGEKSSGKLWVQNGRTDNFERNHTDIFNVECAEELSPAHHLTIGHDNSGIGAGWYLEKVILEAPTTGINQTFFCRKWLADDENDKLIERELYEDMDYRTQREMKNVWNLSVFTSDILGAGTDSLVSFTLYGDKGKTEETVLNNKTNNFERGSVDHFNVELKKIGVPYKIRIGHDNSKMYSDWHLSKVELENPLSKEKYLFTCDRWIGVGEDDGQCVRELPAQSGSAPVLPILPYKVIVYTGDKFGAGTNANVFINIFGERGDTGNRPLLKSKNTNKFERKQIDEFIVEAVDLSKLTSIRIGHDGNNSGDGWYLDKVIIEDPKTKSSYPFLCNRWLATDEDDGLIIRELPVGDSATLLKTTSYHVSVKTGDIAGAGTDANVYLILFGENGDTGKLQLRQAQAKNKWERGRTDMFTLEAMDIGKIKKLIIGHDGKGVGAGWFLESVIVEIPSQGQHLRFSCNRWLAEDKDDKLIERELYPSEERELSKKVPYEIEVHTGDVRGAGTNSNVFIVLYGEEKKSEEFWLRNKTDNFERAQVDKFKIESDEVGPLTKIRIGHDNSGIGSAWFLDKVIVRRLQPPPKKSKTDTKNQSDNKTKGKMSTSKKRFDSEDESKKEDSEDDCNYFFPCNKWFSKNEDDGQIIRELVPFDATGKFQRKNSLPAVTYVVHVYTGDLLGCGTNANVFLTLYGDKGDSGERELKKSETNMDKFERNQVDVFKIDAVSLGKLAKVKIRHDNSGLSSSWFLDKVVVEDTKENAKYLFPCERWLSKTEDDGSLSRELIAVDQVDYERRKSRSLERQKSLKRSKSIAGDNVDLEQMAEQTTYNISVKTGDISGAGTNANVYIVLFGEKGDSGKVELKASKSNKNKFERNQTDIFTTEAVDLGDMTKIRIGHDNKGGFAGWYLDNVSIDAPSIGKKWMFPAGRWLDKDKDDGKLEIDLYPSSDRQEVYQKYVPYEIVVYTSDLPGAGTESNVFIALYGLGGICTNDIFLNDTSKKRKECFNRASVDVFVRELVDVGEQIDKIRIGHDNKGFGAAWHLDKVEVRKLVDNKGLKKKSGSVTFTFLCNRWLAKGEDDGAIVRELVPSKIVEESVDKNGKISVSEQRVDAILEIHKYEVHVYTGDVKGAGTDANVFLIMFGENGDTGERQLLKSETNRNMFERKNDDMFLLEAADLGYIHKVVIRHDDKNIGSDWFLDRIEVIDTSEHNRKFIFNCERWLAKKRDDGKIKRTLYEKSYEGDRNSLHSSVGSLYGSRMIAGSSISVASLEAPQKSLLKRSDSADSVFKQQVNGKMKKSSSKVSLGGASTLGSLLESIPYTVRIWTGEKPESSTEANVFIVFIGTDGASPKIPLELIGKDSFKAGSVETFSVQSEDIGDMKKIELGHDGYLPKDSWYVNKVEVDVPTTGRKYFFPCQCWLGKDKEDGKTARIFSVDENKDVSYKPKILYQITFYTGDIKNAGTDSDIKMTLFGLQGQSSEIKLDKGEERFERGSVDIFRIDIEDVGTLTKLRIGHNGKGSRPHWFLDKVVFMNLITEKVVVFNCGQWFSKTEGDKKKVRELPAEMEGKKMVAETKYTISVKTGDIQGCGTDANVYMILFGENGSSDELKLKESSTNKDKFERGNTDIFSFSMLSLEYEVTVFTSEKKNSGTSLNAMLILVDKNEKKSDELIIQNSAKNKVLRSGQTDIMRFVTKPLDRLKSIYICLVERKEASDTAKKWHLDKIVIKDVVADVSYLFNCNDWIKLSRVQLDCSGEEKSKAATIRESVPIQYEIRVYTADEKGAGTNANVFLTLFGENGDSGKRELKKKFKDLFERGNMDDFKIECLDLGKLTKLIIEHDNKGFKPGWMLDKVEVTNTKDNTDVVFPCEQWLDKKKGDKAIIRELYPS